ncbi:hypothetical protein B0J13DRAFT_672399 [Dactylonectria estremocensis]|uniref:Uncharacterized protein n=1 Tax=Dactylonectria estremocensis TaxID=1079267 RepID=A0A9P9F5V8_9HYPO|nr:hypothetical protein B0J13DRAFT_672399 [Dactylonectria estremocensis]
MRFTSALHLSFLAVLPLLVNAVPVEPTNVEGGHLDKRHGQIPANLDTTACMFYSNVIGVWTYEARIRNLDNPDSVCERLSQNTGETVYCNARFDETCKRDINDPQVTHWKFQVMNQCTYDAVSGIIADAVGHDSTECLISFTGDWPEGTP